MKNVFKFLVAFVAVGTLFSCEPQEDRDSLPGISLAPSDIKINVTTNGNVVTMTNTTDDIIPYWNYIDSKGNDLGHSNQDQNQVTFPFAGKYTVYFTAFTRGGRVDATPVEVNIAQNDDAFFSAPEWARLTKGAEGKTWVLDMASPIGWAGFDYPYNALGADYWNWFPDYAGNEWVMPNKNWGEMTFDLDGSYNVSVTQTALNSDAQTTKTATFAYNVDKHSMSFNGAAELLFGGDYYPDVSNWKTINVVEVTENSLRLSVKRDQARNPNDGPCQIVFHFKPKE
ncbi:hypothetical protein R1T16_13640 [Flavobacterium sp. DG1-102-2]|uniref:hypothetical protein n=1 Tax=Flavobacterium sp. DG1-102-2 TaxID=3081663 RepID=UPI002948C770|nr:hypothetical protein [Flavobacterium sp. DG1-102-2]MDV6169473.1 hypothetical protein [Flavobacterium sp. DG1-102-2]